MKFKVENDIRKIAVYILSVDRTYFKNRGICNEGIMLCLMNQTASEKKVPEKAKTANCVCYLACCIKKYNFFLSCLLALVSSLWESIFVDINVFY